MAALASLARPHSISSSDPGTVLYCAQPQTGGRSQQQPHCIINCEPSMQEQLLPHGSNALLRSRMPASGNNVECKQTILTLKGTPYSADLHAQGGMATRACACTSPVIPATPVLPSQKEQ